MKLNLDERFSPGHVLDIFPEGASDEQILKDFLSFIGSDTEIVELIVKPIHGGICIWTE